MKTRLTFSLVACAAAAFVACGRSTSDRGDGVVIAASAEALQGKWQSRCRDASKFGLTESSQLDVHGTTATEVTDESATGSCGATAIQITQSSTVAAGNPIGPGRALDFTLTKVSVKPMTSTGTSVLNLANFCGIGDWNTGVERDVSGALNSPACAAKLPSKTFDVFTIENGNLFFGKGDLSAAATRPMIVDRNRMYVRR